MHMKENPADLAGSQDLEHERQAMRDELLCVLVLLDAAEVFEKALDQRSAVLDEAGTQGLQPGVQRPGNAWEHHHNNSEYTLVKTEANLMSEEFQGRQIRPCFHHFVALARVEGRLHGEHWISGKSEAPAGIKRQYLNIIKQCPVKK